MTFTPGPWAAVVPPSSMLTCRMITGPDATQWQCVALVGYRDYSEGQDTDLANAQLIAAAPELYDALQDCLALLTDPDAEATDADRVETIVRAALAKAVRP